MKRYMATSGLNLFHAGSQKVGFMKRVSSKKLDKGVTVKIIKQYKLVIVLTSFFYGTIAWCQTIATCGNTEGIALYHQSGLIKKNDSGFKKDEITSGMTTIQKTGPDTYDILMVDSRKKIMSLTQEGGKVMLVRKGSKDATFLHFYPGLVIEIYTIWIDADGKNRYDLIQSKGGDAMPIHKSSVLTGLCDTIRLDLLN